MNVIVRFFLVGSPRNIAKQLCMYKKSGLFLAFHFAVCGESITI